MDASWIDTLDDVAARAVPAAQVRDVAGWTVRYTPGLATRRANSVLPRRHRPGNGVEDKLLACERFYAERGLPVRYQVSPASQPTVLTERLLDRGYAREAPTAVQTRHLRRPEPAGDRSGAAVDIASAPGPEWWETWQAALGVQPPRATAVAALFARLGQPAAFVTVRVGGTAIAVALGVLGGRWLGIFNMVTLPARRGTGAGSRALAAVTRWGWEHGATRAYLQVDLDNAPALRLYRAAGFREAYRYVYLSRW